MPNAVEKGQVDVSKSDDISTAARMVAGMFETNESFLPANYFVNTNHFWVSNEGKGWARIGLDRFAGRMLGPVEEVLLFPEGCYIEQGLTCGVITLAGGTLPIVAPISGKVYEVNRPLLREPNLLARDPQGDDYMMYVITRNFYRELLQLHHGDGADQWYRDEEMMFVLKAVEDSMGNADSRSVGATLPDGGERVTELADLLGPERLYRLLSRLIVRSRAQEKIYRVSKKN